MVLEVLATEISQEKERKWTQVGKEEQNSLFADGMMLYGENPKPAPKNYSKY